MKNRLVMPVAVAFAVFGMSACGNTDKSSSPSSTVPGTTESTPASPPTEPPTTHPSSVPTTAFQADFGNGYKGSGSFGVGSAEPIQSEVASACDADTQTDAEIPFSFSLTNTTNGYSYDSGGGVLSTQSTSSGQNIGMFQVVTGGAGNWQCSNNEIGTMYFSTLAPGATFYSTGYIVIPNYYGPGSPSGDQSLISNAAATLQVSGGQAQNVYSNLTTDPGSLCTAPPAGVSGGQFGPGNSTIGCPL